MRALLAAIVTCLAGAAGASPELAERCPALAQFLRLPGSQPVASYYSGRLAYFVVGKADGTWIMVRAVQLDDRCVVKPFATGQGFVAYPPPPRREPS